MYSFHVETKEKKLEMSGNNGDNNLHIQTDVIVVVVGACVSFSSISFRSFRPAFVDLFKRVCLRFGFFFLGKFGFPYQQKQPQ